ncbi:MAG: hypothetical protein ACOYOB_17120 [Myxococcota bacterium]
MSRFRLSLFVLAIAATAVAGCSSDFDPPSLVKGLRLLAVRAEPPYLAGAPGSSTVLDAKVVGVAPETEVCHAWALCLFATTVDGRFACVDPQLQVDLGVQATATATFDHLATLAAGLVAYQKANPGIGGASGVGGIPSSIPGAKGPPEIKLLFGVAEAASFGGKCPTTATAFLAQGCPDRDRCVIGYRSLAIPSDVKDFHANPEIDLLKVDGKALLSGETAQVVGKAKVALSPQWTELTPAGLPVDATATGDVLFAWYSTAGDFDQQRSYQDYPDNKWLSDGVEAGKTVDVWAVARDDFGGVAWFQVKLQR